MPTINFRTSATGRANTNFLGAAIAPARPVDAPLSFKKLTLLAGRCARALAALSALTPLRFDILLTLYFDGPLIQRELAAEFCVCRSVISKVVTALEALGLVLRKGIDGDRRLRLVTLTNRGFVALCDVFELYGEDPCLAIQQGAELDLLTRLDALSTSRGPAAPAEATAHRTRALDEPRPEGPPRDASVREASALDERDTSSPDASVHEGSSLPKPTDIPGPTNIPGPTDDSVHAKPASDERSPWSFSRTELGDLHSPLREALHRELVYELRMKQRRLCDRDFTGYSFDTDEYGNHCHMAYWMIAPASEPVPSSELHVAAVHFAAGIPLDAAQRSRRKRRPPKVPLGHTPEAAA